MSTPLTQLHIGLGSWIIRDGNYADFRCGERRRFAVEFYHHNDLLDEGGSKELTHLRDEKYRGCGEVVFVGPRVWVIDFGVLCAFRETKPPKWARRGATVSGEVGLGVDPFFYFETLCHLSGIPPLIYEWQIEAIHMETAPFIERKPREFERDKDKLRWVPIAETDAWHDDDSNGEYILTCSRIPTNPAHRIA